MPRTGRPIAYLLAALLSGLPVSRAFALKTERLARFSPASGKTSSLEVASGSSLVKFRTGVSSTTAAAALAAAGFTVDNYLGSGGWAAVGMPAEMSVPLGLDLLKNLPVVEAAEPNRVYRPSLTSNDPFLGSQYALSRVQAFGAWEYETGFSSRATVAVIDTGIDGGHPELSGKLAGSSRYFNPNAGGAESADQPPTPACNHATRAAGAAAAAADNSAGIAGLSWGARLISLKVFSDTDCNDDCSNQGGNQCATLDASIAAAINHVAALHNNSTLGKVVINMSLGSAGTCDPSGALQAAITSAVSAGAVIFVAAGNSGAPFIDTPANCTGVTAVGATDSSDSLAAFSNSDTLMVTKGVAAPGVAIYTTDINGGDASASGTSFSAPITAGLAALLWSAKPSATATEIKDFIMDSADDLGAAGPDRDFGRGRINALKAMRLAAGDAAVFRGETKAVAYPNPFRPVSQRLVAFTVPPGILGGDTEVRIYTSEGEQVRKLDSLAWDGKNETGAAVASGVYIFRVKTDKDAATGKFALIR